VGAAGLLRLKHQAHTKDIGLKFTKFGADADMRILLKTDMQELLGQYCTLTGEELLKAKLRAAIVDAECGISRQQYYTQRAEEVCQETHKMSRSQRANVVCQETYNMSKYERVDMLCQEKNNMSRHERDNMLCQEKNNMSRQERDDMLCQEKNNMSKSERNDMLCQEKNNMSRQERDDMLCQEKYNMSKSERKSQQIHEKLVHNLAINKQHSDSAAEKRRLHGDNAELTAEETDAVRGYVVLTAALQKSSQLLELQVYTAAEVKDTTEKMEDAYTNAYPFMEKHGRGYVYKACLYNKVPFTKEGNKNTKKKMKHPLGATGVFKFEKEVASR
jgi:hypothetical protein